MEFSANQIAELLQGTIEGDSECCVHTLAKIEEGHKGALTFLANPKYTEYIYDTKASIAIVANDFAPEQTIPSTLTLIRVEDPYSCFAKLLDMYNSYKNQETGIHDSAIIHESATIGEDVYIGPNVVISEGVQIGDRTKIHAQVFIGKGGQVGSDGLLHPRCSILADCLIGNHCTIHSGVILGGDGFGFAPNSENNYSKVAQIGNVIIEDHVEIGANTTIDRATLGSTIIRKGAKIDNLIQIAHNVEIGENTVIAAQTGIAGSTKIGKNVMIGGQVGIIGHIKIADGVKIAAQSGIGSSIETEGQIVQGSPAVAIGDFKRSYVGFLKLPKLMTELNEIKKKFSQNS